ncbi:hypothetical protein D3C71_2141800 [compost metagenome]
MTHIDGNGHQLKGFHFLLCGPFHPVHKVRIRLLQEETDRIPMPVKLLNTSAHVGDEPLEVHHFFLLLHFEEQLIERFEDGA